jgi:hypothetical protein
VPYGRGNDHDEESCETPVPVAAGRGAGSASTSANPDRDQRRREDQDHRGQKHHEVVREPRVELLRWQGQPVAAKTDADSEHDAGERARPEDGHAACEVDFGDAGHGMRSLVCYFKPFSSLFVAVPEEKNQICKKSPETGKINSVELVNRARGGQKEATQCS